MDFTPKQHLAVGNYINYLDEILHKCEKGIEYCKLCPNEVVCAELEKDDFGLSGATISDVLAAIRRALDQIPGYLRTSKRCELKQQIQKYIHESPIEERAIWEDRILTQILGKKLADSDFKPKAMSNRIRTYLTYTPQINFAAYVKCTDIKEEGSQQKTELTLNNPITTIISNVVHRYLFEKSNALRACIPDTHYKLYFDHGIYEIINKCEWEDAGLAGALCYYTTLTQSIIPENIAVIGRLDENGKIQKPNELSGKIEMIVRELHFIDTIIVPRDSSHHVYLPENVHMLEVDSFTNAIETIFNVFQ